MSSGLVMHEATTMPFREQGSEMISNEEMQMWKGDPRCLGFSLSCTIDEMNTTAGLSERKTAHVISTLRRRAYHVAAEDVPLKNNLCKGMSLLH